MKDNKNSLSIIIFSDNLFKIHYALTIASAAIACNKNTVVFFAGHACYFLSEKQNLIKNNSSNEEIKIKKSGSPGFEELLKICTDLNITFMVCEAGLSLCKMHKNQIRKDLKIKSGGLYTFLSTIKEKDQIIFI